MMNVLEIIEKNYKNLFGVEPVKINTITQAGSNRQYFRVFSDSNSIIAVYSENINETETFLYYSDVFESLNLNTPHIYKVNKEKNCYFIEDFGDDSLLSIVEKESANGYFTEYLIELYKKSIDALVEMQIKSVNKIDFSKSYSISEFNQQSILFDLNYFKYYFLNLNSISYNEKKLQDEFEEFASFLSDSEKYFMFRDFQSRNILIKDNKPYFIDYQGGRRGALQYDMASLLYQAKAKIPENIKKELFKYYCVKISEHIKIDINKFTEQFYYFVYLRLLQTLGAYGFRGLIEKRSHFIESIPFALQNLKSLLELKPVLAKYKELSRLLIDVSLLNKFENIEYKRLTITVRSFSFRKGYPEDNSGNGGGFIFDCRGILNPGRYSEYKTKTGKDKEVIDFFKQKTDIDNYVKNVINLVKPTIDNYLERNFKSLNISFGCTGGQHRSVYCAESFSNYLKLNYSNIDVILSHREQPQL